MSAQKQDNKKVIVIVVLVVLAIIGIAYASTLARSKGFMSLNDERDYSANSINNAVFADPNATEEDDGIEHSGATDLNAVSDDYIGNWNAVRVVTASEDFEPAERGQSCIISIDKNGNLKSSGSLQYFSSSERMSPKDNGYTIMFTSTTHSEPIADISINSDGQLVIQMTSEADSSTRIYLEKSN